MTFLGEYGLFLAKTITLVAAFITILLTILSVQGRDKAKFEGQLKVTALHDRYRDLVGELKQKILPKPLLKTDLKRTKQALKTQAKTEQASQQPRLFVLRFKGDMRATAVDSLREEISAILGVATEQDEVLLCVDSGGGVVNGYGLAASQLERLQQHHIPLTVAIDKIAASGGYLMAAMANTIIAAPFAIVGSIGVVASMPNLHRFLKKHNIDYEQFTAGEYKRTVTVFGENTQQDKAKFQEDLEATHAIFKDAVQRYRPQLDIDQVATGEHWLAATAVELKLVDTLKTSDDYILEACQSKAVYELQYHIKKKVSEKLAIGINTLLRHWFN